MRKIVMVAAAGIAMAAASVFSNGSTSIAPSSDVRVTAQQTPAPPQQAPAPVQSKAIRETRADGRVRYWRGVPAAIKNRAGGERAHRRWRKTKAAGRQAA